MYGYPIKSTVSAYQLHGLEFDGRSSSASSITKHHKQ